MNNEVTACNDAAGRTVPDTLNTPPSAITGPVNGQAEVRPVPGRLLMASVGPSVSA